MSIDHCNETSFRLVSEEVLIYFLSSYRKEGLLQICEQLSLEYVWLTKLGWETNTKYFRFITNITNIIPKHGPQVPSDRQHRLIVLDLQSVEDMGINPNISCWVLIPAKILVLEFHNIIYLLYVYNVHSNVRLSYLEFYWKCPFPKKRLNCSSAKSKITQAHFRIVDYYTGQHF
jgi:hypothetical protein